MRRYGRPLNRREVFEEVTSAGIEIPGPDRPKRVGATLIKSRRFKNISGRGYWPEGDPAPAAEE